MRKPSILLAIAFLLVPDRSDGLALRVGFDAGTNYTSFAHAPSGAPSFTADGQARPAAGILVLVPGRSLHMGSTLRYQEQGERFVIADSYFTDSQVRRERLLSTSLMLRYRTPFHLVFSFGPQADVLLSGRLAGTYRSGSSTPLDHETDYAGHVNRLDLLAGAGLGMEFPAGRHAIGFEARYAHGLTEKMRPLGYVPPGARPWSDPDFYPYQMNSTRTRRFEASVRFVK